MSRYVIVSVVYIIMSTVLPGRRFPLRQLPLPRDASLQARGAGAPEQQQPQRRLGGTRRHTAPPAASASDPVSASALSRKPVCREGLRQREAGCGVQGV